MDPRDSLNRDLLVGLLALQNGLVDQDVLILAFRAWTRDKSRSIAAILAGEGAIDEGERDLLEGLADKHLLRHGGGAEKSLAALGQSRLVLTSLAEIGDADIEATLGLISGSAATEPAADRTASYTSGTAVTDSHRFRVLRPHARGGLGAVFVALDAELNREVALKQILDHHADDPNSRTRFVLEAEITGGLEHPGIVPVYGLGNYGDGRPYYAMRFVRGDSLKETIAAFQDDETFKNDPGRRSLALRKLLRRFVDVCNAIDYAHTRGVLHRDIKPANVIVGKHGETLVVDWGLAKAMGKSEPGVSSDERPLMPSSASGSAETLPGSAMGTPSYMSPEQAAGDLDLLGPRSDVYSLGATLYCLLTGKAPFAGDDLGAVLRAVAKGDFPPPRRLDPTIDRALEALCLKAMALKPDDRYATSHELADDIERWMADEPVTAWREPLARRARRWTKQNRTGVTAVAAAVVVALVGTAAVLVVQTQANVRLNSANVALIDANQREQERFDLATDAIRTFHTGVTEDLLLKEGRFKELRNKLLRGAVTFYGRLETMLTGQKDRRSRAALGQAYEELGDLTRRVSTNPDAIAIERKALAVWQTLAGEPGAGPESKLGVARSLRAIGALTEEAGNITEGLSATEESRKLVEQLTSSGTGTDKAWSLLGLINYSIASTFHRMGRLPEAMATYTTALDIQQRLANANPADAAYQKAVIRSLCNSGVLRTQTGEIAEGLATYSKARSRAEAFVRETPEDIDGLSTLAWINNASAVVYLQLGKEGDAMGAFERSLAVKQRLADANPNVTYLQGELAVGLLNFGGLLSQTGKAVESIEVSRRALEVYRALAAANPNVPEFQSRMAVIHSNVGTTLKLIGKSQEALSSFREALEIQRRLADGNPSIAAYKSDLAEMRDALGLLLIKMGRRPEALESFTAARDIWRRLADANPSVPAYQASLAYSGHEIGETLSAMGRPDDAMATQLRALAIYRTLAEKDPVLPHVTSGLARTLKSVGILQRAAGRPADSAKSLYEAQGILERISRPEPEDLYRLASTLALLSEAVTGTGPVRGTSNSSELAERAWTILRRAVDAGYKDLDTMTTDHDLDSLRSRRDFKLLMMDLAFPADPFIR